MFVSPLQPHEAQGRHVLREGLQDSDQELDPVAAVLTRRENSIFFYGRESATHGVEVEGKATGRATLVVRE